MSLLDIIRGIPERMGRGQERNIGGLLGIDPEDMTEAERRQARRLSQMAVFDAMARGTSPIAGLREAAALLGSQREARQQRAEMSAAQQASSQIAGRLMGGMPLPTAPGPMAGDELTGVNVQSAYRRDPQDALRMAMTPAGMNAMQLSPQLAEVLKQNVGQQVVGGSIYDRATGQFITPPEAPKPRTPVREVRRGNVVDVYFSDGTMETRPIGVAPSAMGAGAGTVTLPGVGQVKLTPGEQQRDKDFAKDWTQFSAQGGFADTAKQLTQLQEVLARLESGEDLTGPFTGFLMANAPNLAAAYMSGEVGAKEAVEEVAQRNLKLILGAQFTKEEGDRLIARAYNPSLKEEENAKRLRRLIQQMLAAASAKQAAGEYFDTYGTLKGYSAKLPSFADFNLTGEDSGVQLQDVPAGIDPRDWAELTEEQRKLWQ